MSGAFFAYGAGVDDKLNPLVYLDTSCGSCTSLYQVLLSADSIIIQKKADSIRFFGNSILMTYVTSQLFAYSDNNLNLLDVSRIIFDNYLLHRSDTIKLPPEYNLISFVNDSILFFNTNLGALKYNYKAKAYMGSFLENERISNTLKDHEGNLWFTTLGNGIYRLYSEENKNIFFTENRLNNSVESILVTDSLIFVGAANSTLYVLDKPGLKKIASYHIRTAAETKKVIKLIKNDGAIYVLGENALFKLASGLAKPKEIPIEILHAIWVFKDLNIKNDKFYFATHVMTFPFLTP